MVIVMFERIVVAVDGSKQADHALEVACDVAGKYGSKIYLIHAPQLETVAIAVGSGAVEIKPSAEDVAKAGKALMDRAAKRASSHGCTPAECIVGEGAAAEQILKTVASVDADLVVMGRRGLGKIATLLLGSVSQEVSRKATCSCMTVS